MDIVQYLYPHKQGLFILYQNLSKDLTLVEEMAFMLEQCHIEGVQESYFMIIVKPQSEQYMQILADGPGFRYTTLYTNFIVKEVKK